MQDFPKQLHQKLQLQLITGFRIEQVTDSEYNWYVELEDKGYGGKMATDVEIGVIINWFIKKHYPKELRPIEDELIDIIKCCVDESLFDDSNIIKYNTKFI